MNRSDIRRGVEATVEPLSEITRAAVWQRIEEQLVAPERRRGWVKPAATFVAGAAVAATVAVVVARRSGETRDAKAAPIVVVVPVPGEYHRAFAGGELTVYGPGEVELDPTPDAPVLRIQRGTVIVRRAPALAPLAVATPQSTRTTRDPVIALRVTELSTEFASSEDSARALIERGVHELPSREPQLDPPHAPPRQEVRVAPVSPPAQARVTIDTPAMPVSPPDAGVAPVVAPDAGAPVETLADRYARAERAIASDDRKTARDLLEAIARDDATGRLGATASYDLALLAVRDGDPDAALRHLARVLGSSAEPGLRAPAERLRCRIQTARGGTCK